MPVVALPESSPGVHLHEVGQPREPPDSLALRFQVPSSPDTSSSALHLETDPRRINASDCEGHDIDATVMVALYGTWLGVCRSPAKPMATAPGAGAGVAVSVRDFVVGRGGEGPLRPSSPSTDACGTPREPTTPTALSKALDRRRLAAAASAESSHCRAAGPRSSCCWDGSSPCASGCGLSALLLDVDLLPLPLPLHLRGPARAAADGLAMCASDACSQEFGRTATKVAAPSPGLARLPPFTPSSASAARPGPLSMIPLVADVRPVGLLGQACSGPCGGSGCWSGGRDALILTAPANGPESRSAGPFSCRSCGGRTTLGPPDEADVDVSYDGSRFLDWPEGLILRLSMGDFRAAADSRLEAVALARELAPRRHASAPVPTTTPLSPGQSGRPAGPWAGPVSAPPAGSSASREQGRVEEPEAQRSSRRPVLALLSCFGGARKQG
ncbi:hypothetical protein HYH03_002058 [Edaphochlamys debaryana]|uniref:Uncharacterized protein n=1 Tax=Edaphochlamys debaryana TaxID=47281 RepID=A0A835YF57_9CHLO|nr:hypothetical protein HYH03_002058 [Edaphochlamys debaryana]|eukprot:KAG2499761.1 hypothetical protein HYH03_002058 [Edaphochlamys debaryana]